MPALRGAGSFAEAEEQPADFAQREAALARALDDGEAMDVGEVVTSLATNPLGGQEDSDALIVADGGGSKTDSLSQFRNCQLRHGIHSKPSSARWHRVSTTKFTNWALP